ncbi:23S rRNA (adenine(1618)-N(6))-methyltransferase RlmF [Wenyingzhuangia sp. chi5]|uniref:23S rRNA (Adenine(1618)-N(6))-methyltransferase RlmF n=1 Tax=Wenyingzhuangia gilva TaxID=3057677 RepID=A0ABT8VTB8_9FLAO|nr:23S rRNA (adenine(1618)-N(6))-methyltransferase RlmF [Wenyingzhuangia sp. chi5]MDO3695211.1 23S rRNA (adenine(1618)-N(6))-methyltransferase RlmF [Wenyingzhuangia sp. chi5]
MSKGKPKPIKNKIHSRNRNKERYDLKALISINPELKNYIKPNIKGEDTIDFTNPMAIKALNKSLLHYYYGIENWTFSDDYLCPSIPNKADYIHHMADLLMESNFGNLPLGNNITCYDIGMGATCIYPMIGVTEYDWNFIGSDIDENAIISAQSIISKNESLKNKIVCRLQGTPKDFFYGIIDKEEKVDFSICNPPLYASLEDAKKGTQKKNAPYSASEIKEELIYDGGETGFLQKYVKESKKFAENCFWFSALVSKQSNQKGMVEFLEELGATQTKVIPMGIGNKSSQIIAWTFLTKEAQIAWKKLRWTIKK